MDKFNPAAFAGDLQTRTRQQNKFDDFEKDLPDPQSATYKMSNKSTPSSSFSVGGLVKKIGDMNPFGKNVNKEDIVWLLDNTAFRESRVRRQWQAEYVAAVFERDPDIKLADIVSGIAHKVGLADDAKEKATIEERILPFLWDIRMVRIVKVDIGGKQLKMTPTNVNGISTQVLKIPSAEKGQIVKSTAQVPTGVSGLLEAQTFYAGPEGWGIISDIDDTIKITMTSDPVGILESTFVNESKPVPGMPELYAQVKQMLPQDTPWFYLSASPYNLYPLLQEFRNKFFPPGTLILRDFSWKTVAGLLSALTMGTEEYKTDRIKKVNGWFPKRKMIVLGDSTQSDPEAYGEIYRTVPGWIKLILIRKVEDVAAIGIGDKNEPSRFEKAFEGVPREQWHVFSDPAECQQIIQNVIAQDPAR